MPTLDTADATLAYHTRGEGEPVLLIQGAGAIGALWAPQIDGLAGRYSLAWFDNRGIGDSLPLRGPVTVEAMARDALAVMDALGWASAHVVGHSMGGLIAQQVALLAPARVRSLALLCTFARGADAARVTPWMMWVGLRVRVGPRAWRRRAFLEMVMPPSVLRSADLDALAAELAGPFGRDLADQPDVVMAQVRAMSRTDLTPRLGEIDSPTLVVSADGDRMAPVASGRSIADGIPGARFVQIGDAAHGVTLQRAEHVNSLLTDHWARCATGPA